MTAAQFRQMTCCFTGHRDLPSEKKREIAERTAAAIRALITDRGVRYFGVGGAVGYDTLAAEVLFKLKETEYPHIKVILVYPFEEFTDRWTAEQQAAYERLLPKYDKVVCACSRPSREAYLARDRHLVNGSAYCIAYCTRNTGGTAYTVRYAHQQGATVQNIAE